MVSVSFGSDGRRLSARLAREALNDGAMFA
jgi:hypothetical protein